MDNWNGEKKERKPLVQSNVMLADTYLMNISEYNIQAGRQAESHLTLEVFR